MSWRFLNALDFLARCTGEHINTHALTHKPQLLVAQTKGPPFCFRTVEGALGSTLCKCAMADRADLCDDFQDSGRTIMLSMDELLALIDEWEEKVELLKEDVAAISSMWQYGEDLIHPETVSTICRLQSAQRILDALYAVHARALPSPDVGGWTSEFIPGDF